ncbi:MAG: ABC transporter substrate-binding protein [Spirochaetaceae bacterium]|nr:ABC transporter substrate-binding protein [Spirochaetaceae bacterium]
MKKLLRLLVLLMMLTMMVSCVKKENVQTTDLANITVLLDWAPNTNHTGLYVAQQKGYYTDEGLDVRIAQPSEGGTEMLVASGKAQFGVSFQDSLVPAFLGNDKLPVTAIAALIQHNTSGLLSLKEKGIDRPMKLEGYKYATWDMDIEKAIIKKVMETDGGDYSKLKLIPSTVADAVSAIQTHVDCVWVYYAWDKIRADIAGVQTNFIDFKDYGNELDYYNPVLIAGNDFLKNNPEQAKAFLRATEKGYHYAMEHPDEAAVLLTNTVPELDKTLVTKSQEWLANQYQADATHWGEFDADRWNGFYNWLYNEKVIDSPIPEGTGFTNDYLPLD